MSESEKKPDENADEAETKKAMGVFFLVGIVFVAIGIGCVFGAGYGWLSIGSLLVASAVKYLKTGTGLLK